MNVEHYFSETVNENTWKDFIRHCNKGDLNKFYTKISGYGWKDNFGFTYDGKAFYISEHGYEYEGICFIKDNTRTSIFKK